jgi:hypothetical protein
MANIAQTLRRLEPQRASATNRYRLSVPTLDASPYVLVVRVP